MLPRISRLSVAILLCIPSAPTEDLHASPPPWDGVRFRGPEPGPQQLPHSDPAAKRTTGLNVGEPRTVRIILFLPSDRPFRVGLVDSIKTAIVQSQAFFGEQMRAHGYGYRTFRLENDAQGEPLVHRVYGQHPESHYFAWSPRSYNLLWREEIEQVFDLGENIHVLYRDSPNYRGGAAGLRESKRQGEIRVTRASGGLFSHELAHAFGLPHDFRDGAYILSYGGPSQFPGARRWDRISACTAEFLSVHPYFNSAIPIEESSPPTIKLASSTEYPGGSQSVSIKLELSDKEGLHQVLLYALPGTSLGLRECRALEGQRDAVVEFEYDGSPMATNPERLIKSLSDPLHKMEVRVVDTDGDMSELRFELAPDRVTNVLSGHTDLVNAVAYSPDGTLASGSSDGTVKLWDVSGRELLATLFGHSGPVMAVAFSRDGTLASGSMSGIRLWDVTTRNRTATLVGIAPVAYSPDGTLLASGTRDRTIAIWELRTLEKIATLEGHAEKINTVAFSPDGTLLASGSGQPGSKDQTIRLWDVEKREEVATFEHTGAVWSVAFSPDGAVLASAVGDNRVWLWDVGTHGVSWLSDPDPWYPGPVLSVAFSRGGSILVSGSRDGKVRLYDALTRDFIGNFLPFRPRDRYDGFEVRSVAISPDETTLAAGRGYGTIELRDVSKWKRPPFPFGLEIISGDDQQGVSGNVLDQPLIVEVRDQYGNLLPDARATFSVTAGEGKLSGRFTVQHVTTDADGRAELTLVLGPQPGPNTVGVSLGGHELAAFTAKGVGTAVAELEGDYRTWHLPAAATVRLGKGVLGSGDRAVALSADGGCLAVASGIGVWLYEAATSRTQALLPMERAVHSVAFSLGGTLAAGLDNGRVELWEVEAGERVGTVRHADWGGVTVVFSPDGTSLASGSRQQVIRVWDVETRQLVGTWEVPRGTDRYSDISLAFSPDGSRLVSGFQDGTVRLWDVTTQAEVVTLEGHTGRVVSVSFSPDGSLLASAGGGGDRTVRLWDAATRTEIATLRGHTGEVRSVSFSSPDGGTLASGSSDGTVRLWDVAAREETATLEEHGDGIRSVTFSRDGATLVSAAADGKVLLREVETGNAAGLSGYASLSSMAHSGDGVTLALGYQDGTVRLWDAATMSLIAALRGHLSWVMSLSFSSDGATLASGSWDRTVRLWDVKTREPLGTLEGHGDGVYSVAFSPDGVTLASGSRDRTVLLWDVSTREQIGILEGHNGDVRSVAFSSDGALLASGGGNDDKTIRLWNVATREPIGIPAGHTGAVSTVSFSSDNSLLASGSWDRTIRLWDVKTRELTATLDNRSAVYSLAFSSDGATLVSGSSGRTDLWNVDTREQIATLEGHTRPVHTVAFSDDGNVLATGSSDGTTLLWDLAKYLSLRIPDPDFDGDGTVGFADFLQFAAQFGLGRGDAGYDARFDLDGNGAIGFSDFLVFASNFGRGV